MFICAFRGFGWRGGGLGFGLEATGASADESHIPPVPKSEVAHMMPLELVYKHI